MSQIKICRELAMDEEECRVVAEDLLDQLVEHFGGSVQTGGENYRYRHSTGIKADVTPANGEITIDVTLGLLTRGLAPQLEREINRVLDEKLADL